MKIGRNEPCPCGSGKKYKNCCLNKNIELNKNSNNIDEQLFDPQLVKSFIKIFNNYDFFDLARAIFCINSWRSNRPELELYLSLNQALFECSKTGKKTINNYTDFITFFNLIKKFYSFTIFVDKNIPDFGEVWIVFNNEKYPVFLGTGHNAVFAEMQCLEPISYFCNKKEETLTILSYVKNMINSLQKYNCGSKNSYGDLFLPSKDYFNACLSYYSKKQQLSSPLEILTMKKNKNISSQHFIKCNNEYYPLFNPNIIIDHISNILKYINENQITKLILSILYHALKNNFFKDYNEENLMINIGIVEDKSKHKILNDYTIPYAIILQNQILFLINNDKNDNDFYKDYFSNIINYQKENNLLILTKHDDTNLKIIKISKDCKLNFLLFDSFLDINNNHISMYHNDQEKVYFFIDLIYMIYRSDSINDIIDFINFNKINNLNFFSTDGLSGLFEAWLSNNKILIQGALDVDNITIDLNLPEWTMYKKYIDINKWFPEKVNYYFSNPLSIITKTGKSNFISIIDKSDSEFCGYYKKIKSSYLYIIHNIKYYSSPELAIKKQELRSIFDEILMRNLQIIENELISSGFYNNNGVNIINIPYDNNPQSDEESFFKNCKYVFSSCESKNNLLIINFIINEKNLIKDLENATTKAVEINFIKELLSCLSTISNINLNKINDKLNSIKNDKKDFGTLKLSIPYYFNLVSLPLHIKDQDFIDARKKIAMLCSKNNIKPGNYNNDNATQIIRDIQNSIIPYYENEIKKFDKNEVNLLLMSELAYYYHNKRIELKRYSITTNNYLSDEAQKTSSKIIIKCREDYKQKIRVLLYMLDTNNAIIHTNTQHFLEKNYTKLYAYADWLLVLQNVSDTAHYKMPHPSIRIEDDYRISTILDESANDFDKKLYKRCYDNIDYRPTNFETLFNFKKLNAKFKEDTGIELIYVIKVCEYLSNEFTYTFAKNEIFNNVFKVPINTLIQDLYSIIKNINDEIKENIKLAFDFLELKTDKIKIIDNKLENFIPIWKREKREYRFEIRPLIKDDDTYIFSPVVLYELYMIWTSSPQEFYLPYEFNLNNTYDFLKKIKKKCEKQMETDVYNLFNDSFIREKNFIFYKREKNKHPQDLGDYDVIAIDKNKKIIWNIECKFLQKVGSIRKFANHQTSFFIQNKKDEKFQKRIDYLKNHKEDLFRILQIQDDPQKYIINNYMVTNKLFYSQFKKINFNIITYNELEKLLK